MRRFSSWFSFWLSFSLSLTLTACRETPDHLLSYGQEDDFNFSEAKESFEGKFKIFWEGMNCNYAIWDYEAANGTDWDAVYDDYLPKFQALDEREDSVSDDELRSLLEEMVAPLHDGHLYVQMQNHMTGHFVSVSPGLMRVQSRLDYERSKGFVPNLDVSELKEYDECDTNFATYYARVDTAFAVSERGRLLALTSPTEHQEFLCKRFGEFLEDYLTIPATANPVEAFNELCLRYEFLQIPGLKAFDPRVADFGLTMKYALTKDHIAYLYVSRFCLTPWLNQPIFSELLHETSDDVLQMRKDVCRVWVRWYDKVQELHNSGQLRGVVVDVRSNGGGMINDFQYVLGALLPAQGFVVADARFKRGVGRYDYSALIPQQMATLLADREVITEPVVVLGNCCSASLSETTCLAAKLMENGRLVGTRTWGALCMLMSTPSSYSISYASSIGVKDVTPVFCYIPMMAMIPRETGILEGIGITPDMEVQLDETLLQQGRDSQLECAFEYCRNH